MRNSLFIAFILHSFLSIAQVPELELQEVNVSDSMRKFPEKALTLRRPAILELQAEDAGQLLQKIAGINIKSYGGLGGLKTISVRSLGSQHTSIVVDGFSLNNTQTGQINLGHVQTDNIESMYVSSGALKNIFVPISAQVSGSILSIETFENSFSTEKHRVRFSSKAGSFGQLDNYLSYKLNIRKMYMSVFGKYRYADGTYNYSFQNGPTLYEGIRENNKYEDAYAGLSFGWRISENGVFNFNFRTEASDQQLPGAVILYSQNSFQTLTTANNRFQAAYLHHFKKLTVRTYSSGTIGNLSYLDPNYLNEQGEIFSSYRNENLQIGITGRYDLNQALGFFGGTEQQISRLTTNINGFGIPFRNHNFSVLGLKYKRKIIHITAQVSTQFVEDKNDTTVRQDVFRANPFIQIETNELNKKTGLVLTGFYRNSMRMPSFNELYYNNIGNTKLKPEDANQFSAGFLMAPKLGKLSLMNRTNVYYNQVDNKIVAIPTKNLFIRSMQNIGKVSIFGVESTFDLYYKLNEKWSVSSNLNYTLQLATDITDTESPTFGHQIAYIPKHSFNADISVKRKSLGFRWSTFGNSLRYSLNENISSNEVNGFTISDVSVFGSFNWKKHSFRWQFSCKNIFNSSYAIVRLISSCILLIVLFACKKDKPDEVVVTELKNGMLVLCEGLFQQNNASLSWVNTLTDEVNTDFFTVQNNRMLGDTGNDMKLYGGKIYIVVNNSNTIEVLSKLNGKSIKQISMVNGVVGKQPRSIAFYGSKAFITCYDGFVDVLDTASLTITQRIQVGTNPEGLAISNGKLFVANSGGLNSIVDSTVSVIDLATYSEITKITVGKNPGSVKVDAQGDVYVIARGNYGTIPSRMVKLNTVNNTVDQTFTFDASGMERMNQYFLISFYNYSTETSEIRLFNTQTETIENNSFIATSSITTLYGIQYNPQNDKIYCLDAMNYTNTGYVRQYNASGVFEKSYHVGLNPNKILFYE